MLEISLASLQESILFSKQSKFGRIGSYSILRLVVIKSKIAVLLVKTSLELSAKVLVEIILKLSFEVVPFEVKLKPVFEVRLKI